MASAKIARRVKRNSAGQFVPLGRISPGDRFGRLTAVSFSHRNASGQACWLCKCTCGETCVTRQSRLIGGVTRSCGCYRLELHTKHGFARRGKVVPEHKAWREAIARTTNRNNKGWPYYGGRGIRVCPRWLASFAAFFKDVGPRPSPAHSLDRIDNDGGYEPGNVRWATKKQQANNRRKAARTRWTIGP